jgi:hypothetical protein
MFSSKMFAPQTPAQKMLFVLFAPHQHGGVRAKKKKRNLVSHLLALLLPKNNKNLLHAFYSLRLQLYALILT